MNQLRTILALAIALLAGPALAQSPPFTYPQTIGTGSVQILAANPARKKLIFINPNDTAKIAVCPVGPSRVLPQVTVVAVINGPGCATILPYGQFVIDNSAAASNPPLAMGTAWVGIASAGASALTILEFE